MSRSFMVNGRFLAQAMTGVQRYAHSIVSALDQFDGAEAGVVATPKAVDGPGYTRLGVVASGMLQGHAWEQFELPRMAAGQRLLNLCNTAPALKQDQIVCIHDANVFSAPESYNAGFRTFYRTIQPLLARRSLRIATVSQAAARQISRHLPISLSQISVLPNGHEHALSWDAGRSKLAAGLSVFDGARPYVLVLGSRARHKNLALVRDIAPWLDDIGINVVVAGGGNSIFTDEAVAGRSNIFFCGRVSDDDLAYLLDRALCLAFPSLAEGFGLPIVEAMARGCPVISADCASMPEVCGNAALLASPFRPQEWVAQIGKMALSKQMRDDLAGLGREQVRRFLWKESAQGYLDLINSQMAEPAKRAPSARRLPRIAVVFATRGRPDVVATTVRHFMATQTLRPASVIVSCVTADDAGNLASVDGVDILLGPGGLAAQRNTALNNLDADTDIVIFFDDDFVADPDWVAAAAQVFQDESSVAGFTGLVIADGIKGPGISFEAAVALVAGAATQEASWNEPFSPYGCNMAFRVSAIGDLRFDERLVLYGWLEDRDFGAALRRRGNRLVKSSVAFGVHMGVKSGRVNGERLGYSQIANPLYMLKKRTMNAREAADHIFRNTASNFFRALAPEAYVDRRGRVIGNMRALMDAVCGRLDPERAATIGQNKKAVAVGRKPVDV